MKLPLINRDEGGIAGSPKVSVLVPCYNVERYLEQCLDSLVSQTLSDIQIICINDGSTDSTLSIINDYASKDKRITVINKSNSGYGASMNLGLAIASGAYVGILESDDFAEPNMLEDLYNLAERYSLDVAKAEFLNYCNGVDTKEETFKGYRRYGIRYGKVFDPADTPEIIRSTPSIWSALYRRRMLVENGIQFSETPGASFQDTAFVLKCWFAARRALVTKGAYIHYRNDNPDSSVKSTGKVHAVADEFVSADRFMRSDPPRREHFIGQFNLIRFDTYRWNYNRLAPELHEEFAHRMRDDYCAALDGGDLRQEQFDGERWLLIEEILASPEQFAHTYEEGF